MAKFKIKLKLQGLELEIDGERQDAHLITQNLSQQFAGLIKPAAKIVEGEVIDQGHSEIQTGTPSEQPVRKKRRLGKAGVASVATDDEAFDYRHDPQTWGNPKQTWSSSTKSVWLLYVLKKQASKTEMSAKGISSTFNKHFKQAGIIRYANLSRDLGLLKSKKTPAWVGEDTTKTPSAWFLTDEGLKQGEGLVIEAKGGASTDN